MSKEKIKNKANANYWKRDAYVRRVTAVCVLLPLIPVIILGNVLHSLLGVSKHSFFSFAAIVIIAFAVFFAEEKAKKKFDKGDQ